MIQVFLKTWRLTFKLDGDHTWGCSESVTEVETKETYAAKTLMISGVPPGYCTKEVRFTSNIGLHKDADKDGSYGDFKVLYGHP